MKDARKKERKHALRHWKAVDADTGAALGELVDMTIEGVMLQHPAPMAVGTVYHVKIVIQPEMLGRDHIAFHAKSLWCKKDDATGQYHTGFTITGLTGDNYQAAKQLIKHYTVAED